MASFIINFAFAAVPSQATIFGVSMRWESPSDETMTQLEAKIRQKHDAYTRSWDPDCIWRKKKNNLCEAAPLPETLAIEKLAVEMREETEGYFDADKVEKNKPRRRDFSGLSQGLFIDELKKELPGKWVVDFAGDIYFSGGFTPSRPFTIADPLNEYATFAKVQWKSGWMVSSSSRRLGQNVWNPKAISGNWSEDFQRVVLFAHPEFNGYRLDAWSTALIPGGAKLLKKLWADPKYRGKWAYLYFDKDGAAHCSENLECDFKNASNRIIKVRD